MTYKQKEITIAAIGDQIKRLLVNNTNKIFQGYQTFGFEDFPIGISVKMSGGIEAIKVNSRISFSTEKIKDETEKFINTRQANLFAGMDFQEGQEGQEGQESFEKVEGKFNPRRIRRNGPTT